MPEASVIAKYHAETALAVPGPQIFPADSGAVVTITNWTEQDSAGAAHRGLVIDVALTAPDALDGLRRGLGAASRVVSLLAFSSAAATGPIRPFIAYAERADGSSELDSDRPLPHRP